jgi:uncharacterized protein
MAGRIHDGFVPGHHQIDAMERRLPLADMSHAARSWRCLRDPRLGRDGAERVQPGGLRAVFADGVGVEILLVRPDATSPGFPADLRSASARRHRPRRVQARAAARTYNVLVAENRQASAAALIAVE